MNVETLQSMSRIAFIIAIAALLISILMFFLFNIPKLFNELTGRAAKRFIAEAQKKNEVTEAETGAAFGTSENLLSSELISAQLSSPSTKTVTTKLTSLEETTKLATNPLIQNAGQAQQNANQKIPIINPNAGFSIIEEFSFTSSTEIIE
ncbi:MAG: hypothetical protein K2G25_08685 [Oscillospiraceae bacterium]|nr:hypothetical protein [Oscillospiraceae bacterium]